MPEVDGNTLMAGRKNDAARYCFWILGVLSVFGCVGSVARAAQNTLPVAANNDWSATEQWVWHQLSQGNAAYLDENPSCKGETHPAPTDDKDPRWKNPCREIRASFLHDVLTRAPWQEALPHQGVEIDGAHIVDQLDLEGAKLVRQIWIGDSRIEDRVILRRARTESLIALTGTFVKGDFNANSLYSESDLMADGTTFGNGVHLVGARIAGQVAMSGASVTGKLDAGALQAHDLYIQSDATNKASFAAVSLSDAKIAGQVAMVGASVAGALEADSMQVGTDLFMSSDRTNDDSGRDTGNGRASFAGAIDLVFARIGGNLDLRGSTLAELDLSGASVGGELAIGIQGGLQTTWKDKDGKPASLKLRNTHIVNLSDHPSDKRNGWPAPGMLQLDGITIIHLGGFTGDTGKQMRDRGMDWWDSWARLDPDFSSAPYTQLANTFTAMGDRDAANDIRFLGRARERETRCAEHAWTNCLTLFALEYVAGFGIGTYTFRVIVWVLGFSLIGTGILWWRVPAERRGHHGWLWCFGASLSRLLPVIEINKEFTDFFNDPDRKHLYRGQAIAFSALSLVGWVLGAILVAALSGLTQNP